MAKQPTSPRQIDNPMPGYFRRRLVRGGPWVAFQICLSDGFWFVRKNGRLFGPPGKNPFNLPHLLDVWQFAQQILKDEHDAICSKFAAGELPDPEKPIDLEAEGPLF